MALFDEQTYLKNKAAQLNATGFEGKQWDAQSVKSAFSDSGLSAQDHYQQYGKKEGVTPYNTGSAPSAIKTAGKIRTNQFDANNYLNNKALQLNKQGYGGKKDWTAEQARLHMRDSGMTPEEHYQQYGRAEGVDPYVYQPGITSAPSYSATTRSINPQTDTVQGQITGLLDKNNPYMQRARARGLSAANSRGLLNSTMAGQAGEAAAIDAALPIASQDADSYLRQGMTNQQYQNQASRDNANFELSTGQFNAEYGQRMDLATMDDLRAREMQQEEIGHNRWAQEMEDSRARDMQRTEVDSSERMQQAEIASREQIAQWDRETRETIAGIELDAQTRAQFLESTNELMQQYQIQFQEIATNKDLSSDARDAAWRSLREMYDEQIKLSGDMMGVPLTKGSYDVNEGTASWNVGENTAGEGDRSANPPEGGQPPITSRDGNTPILAEDVGLIQQKPAKAVRDYGNPDTIPRDMQRYKSFGIDTLYAKEDGSYPTPQDLGQTEPPQGDNFRPWLQSRASRFWRYKNPEVAVASGGQPLRTGDLSGLERQVFDDIPGTIRARKKEAEKNEGNQWNH